MKSLPLRALIKIIEWLRGRRFNRAERRALFHRPRLEILEDRLAPTAVTWMASGSGNWDVPANWSGDAVPNSGDDVTISTTGSATITINPADHETVHSLATAANDTLAIAGGSLTIIGTATSSALSGPLTMTSNASLTASGQPVTVTGATSITASSLFAEAGADFSLPEFTTYAAQGTFEAIGAGSILDLSALTSFTQTNGWLITAGGGGTIKLSALTSLVNTLGPNGIVLSDTTNGTILDGNLRTLTGVSATLDGTDAHVADSWTKFNNGSLDITGGSYSLSGLTDVDGSTVAVNSASLTLSGVTSYAADGSSFEAIGTGSVLNVANLATLTHTGSFTVAADGGEVALNGLSSTALAATDTLNVSSGSTIDFAGANLVIPASTSTFDIPQLPDGVSVVLTLNADYTGAATFNVGQGPTVYIAPGSGGLEFLAGVSFDVAPGATVDLTDGLAPTYGGTLSDSGGGTVQLGSGTFTVAPGGATIAFAGTMFQWKGGGFDTSEGNLINADTINLAGAGDMGIFGGGTFDNQGSMIQTGAGSIDLYSDNTTLVNEANASYLMESNTGIDDDFGGSVALENAGTIKKTAGSGVSYLEIDGPLSNTGLIEADAGTLYLDAFSVAQVSGQTLTAGTWAAADGGVLQFPGGTNITTNAANLVLGSGGGIIIGIQSLDTNSGSLNVAAGALLNISGNLSNSGSITVGGSLNVASTFTQSPAGTLIEQIAGTPPGGPVGQLGVTGSATLAGTFDLTLANGFTPTAGQQYIVVSFASVNGDFTTFTGLGSDFTETLNSNNLELTAVTPTPIDLVVSNVQGAAAITEGEILTAFWTVTDNSTTAAMGNWQDSVYLSADPTIDASSLYLGAALYTGGLSGGASYNASFSGPVFGLAPGNYYLIVVADSLYQLAGANRADSTLASAQTVAASIPALAVGASVNSAFTGADQDQYYQIAAPAGGSLQITAVSTANSGALAVYVSQGVLPTPFASQESAVLSRPDETATVPQVPAPATYYVLVQSVFGAAAAAGYSLTAVQTDSLGIQEPAAPWSAGNGGNATIEIDGANFTAAVAASLAMGATTIAAASIDCVSAGQLFATFPLTGAAPGSYSVTVQQGGQSATALTPFQVVPAVNTGGLNYTLTVPAYVRSDHGGLIDVTVVNNSNNDLSAPFLSVDADGAAYFGLPSVTPESSATDFSFLATSPTGLPGILTAGETVNVPIDFVVTQGLVVDFEVTGTDTSKPFNIADLIASPSAFAAENSNGFAALTYLNNDLGPTWAGYVAMLDRNANLIPSTLGAPDDLHALLNIEIDKALAAVNTSISGVVQSSELGVTAAGQTIMATDTATGDEYAATVLNDGSFVFDTLPASTYTFSVDGLVLESPPTVTLNPGQALTGLLLTAAQGAVIGGQVSAQGSNVPLVGATIDASNEASGQGFEATSDANGNYTLSGLPAGVYDLVVNATGYAQAEILGVDVTNGNAAKPVTLAPESSIAGTISLANGGAAESTLQVVATIDGSTDANQTYAASSTTPGFSLDGLPAGTYDVSIELPGYITQTISDVAVAAGQAVDLGNLTLAPASEIDGTVTSTDPNTSAGNLVVNALQNGVVVAGTITDAAGDFQLTDLQPGTYTLASALGAVISAPTVTVTLGRTLTGQAITIQPGGTISGQVTSPGATPLSGMTVDLSGPGGLLQITTTDANGDYEFTGLAAASYEVYLPIGGAQASQTVAVTQVNGTAVTANLQLAYVATISGALTDGGGNPITDGNVTMYASNVAIATAQTNAAGIYEFLVFQPGVFDLAAAASEGTFPLVTGLTVNAGDTVTQNFQTGTATLSLTATDGAQPAAGATATLEGLVDGSLALLGETTVASDGTASFANLTPGSYTVDVSASDGDTGQTDVTVSPAGASAGVTLNTQASASGTVTGISSNPLSGATVLFQLSSNLQQFASAATAADGTYAISSLPPGTYDVTVFADGYRADTQTSIVVTASANTTVNAALTPSTTTIAGTLIDQANNPVPGGTVTVFDSAGHLLGLADVTAAGTFQITTAAGTNLTLQASDDGYAAPQPTMFDAPAGQTTTLAPIVLQAVAIDPGQANSGGSAASAVDGQGYADAALVQAAGWNAQVKTVTPEGPPACKECDIIYKVFYLGGAILTNLAAGRFQSQYAIVQGTAQSLTDTANNEYNASLAGLNFFTDDYLALESIAVGGGLSSQNGSVGNSAYSAYVVPVSQAAGKVTKDAGAVLTAADPAAIIDANNQYLADVAALATAVTNSINGLKAIITSSGFDGKYDQASTLNSALIDLEQLIYPTQNAVGFPQTIAFAQKLQSQMTELSRRLDVWQPRYDNFTGKLTDDLHNCEAQPCQQDPPSFEPTLSHQTTQNVHPSDPNALIGPAGYGAQGFIQPTAVLPYTVDFENDGTAAALDVTVREPLDPNLNWATFQLGSFGWGDINVIVPTGLTQYQTTMSYQNSDGTALNVQVSLNFNVQTGVLTATFTSLDPTTGQAPTGVFDGFLYPEDGTGVGEGFVQYSVQPLSTLLTGATINQQAAVVFDTNTAIDTNTATNTIDAGAPTSSVNPLPSTSLSSFTVSWSGQDDPGGSGIAAFDVYDSDNGGPFQLWQNATAATSAVFSGVAGHTYAFYSVAIDNAGNVQPTPTAAQASTTVNPSFGIVGNPKSQLVPIGQNAIFTAAIVGTLKPTVQWQVSADGGSTWSNIPGATKTTLDVTATQAQNGAEYRAVFSSSAGHAITTVATLTVSFIAMAATKPATLTIAAGTPAVLTAAATGDPAPTVQWMVSTNHGQTFTAINGATSAVYGFTPELTDSGKLFEAVFTNGIGKPVATAAITLTVDAAVPSITTSPTGQSAPVGGMATFAASGLGSPTPTVQWQVSTDGGHTFSNIAGATKTTLTLTKLTAAQDGGVYRAIFTNPIGQEASAAVLLTVEFAPVVTKQPASQKAAAGALATFTAASTAEPAPSVQWMISTNNGKSYSVIPGANSPSYSFTAQAGDSGQMFEAVFTNGIGNPATTKAATLTIAAPPGVQANPSSETAVNGAATFSVEPTGTAPKVQWQVSTNGAATWSNVAGATAATLPLKGLTGTEDQWQYRVLVTNALGTFTSGAATLTVQFAPVVTKQPISQTAAIGTPVTFTAAASADPAATVQWMLSTDGGKTYGAITGATAPSYSFTAQAGESGQMFEAVFTNGIGKPATTKAAALTIAVPPGVQANPTNQTAINGAATFSVVPTGTSPKVQWQVSTNAGTTWSNVAGATAATLSLKGLTGTEDQWRYRVLVTNALGTFTGGPATLTVQFAPTVTKQPISQTSAAGTQVTFTAASNADPTATVQWMVSTNKGKTYGAITGATSPSYSFMAEAGDSGNLYEAVFTNGIGKAATTTAATLTIAVRPGVQANPSDQTAINGAATFSVVPTGTAPKVQWQVSTNGGATWSNVTGATAATLALKGLTGAEDQWRYRVLVTNALGTFTSGAATLTVHYGPVISA